MAEAWAERQVVSQTAMGTFARLFSRYIAPDLSGARLNEATYWEVTPPRNVGDFLRALPVLAPIEATAYFEGTVDSKVADYLRGISIVAPLKIAVGTIWPKPDCYHVPLSTDTMARLAEFVDQERIDYLCWHCHVHNGTAVLLQWHDAFGTDPILVATSVGEESIKRFANVLGSSYSTNDAR